MLLSNVDIRLRALEPEDLEILYQWENRTDLWLHGNTLSPYSKLALRQYIYESQQYDIYQNKQLRLMVELTDNEQVIGTVDLYELDIRNKRAGIGILIDTLFRNKHFGTQTLELIRDYAFSFLKLHQLYAYIATDNQTSLRIFGNSGYKPAGILKDWIQATDKFIDVQLMQLINE